MRGAYFKANAERIITAAMRAREPTGGPLDNVVQPTELARRILDAGRRRRGEIE